MARERRYFLLAMGALAAGACSLVYDPDGLRQGAAGSAADGGVVGTDGNVSVDGGDLEDAGNTGADGGSTGCGIRCGVGRACPFGTQCGADQFCHRDPAEKSCSPPVGSFLAENTGTYLSLLGGWGAAEPRSIFVAGDDRILVPDRAGSWRDSWVDAQSRAFHAVWGTGTRSVFVVGQKGGALRFDGSQWAELPTGLDAYLYGVWASASDDVVAVGGSSILRYTGSGWQPQATGGVLGLNGVWGTGRDNVYATSSVGAPDNTKGAVLRFNGSAWSKEALSPLPRGLRAIWGSGPADIFVVGDGGEIFHFDGAAWAKQASGTVAALRGVWGSGPADVYAAGSQGTLLRYDGQDWKPLPSGTTARLNAVFGVGLSDVFLVGEGGTLLHMAR